jgi:hypothetical protein
MTTQEEHNSNGLDPGQARQLSCAMRESMSYYDLRPNEAWLAHLLILETIDRNRKTAPVCIEGWAGRQRMRPDKCAKVFETLIGLGLVDVNCGQGIFELRPDSSLWSRERALRRETHQPGQVELPMRVERPLSEALSEVSRENVMAGPALGSVSDPVLFGHAAEKSATRRKNPPTPKPLETLGFGVPAEKSAAQLAELASCNREASSIELASSATAEKSAAALTDRALERLTLFDKAKALADPLVAAQWLRLASENPRYILHDLTAAYDRATEKGHRIHNPLAWLSRKARADRQLADLRRVCTASS